MLCYFLLSKSIRSHTDATFARFDFFEVQSWDIAKIVEGFEWPCSVRYWTTSLDSGRVKSSADSSSTAVASLRFRGFGGSGRNSWLDNRLSLQLLWSLGTVADHFRNRHFPLTLALVLSRHDSRAWLTAKLRRHIVSRSWGQVGGQAKAGEQQNRDAKQESELGQATPPGLARKLELESLEL